MKTERQLYYKLFNRITDTIETLEDELRKLRLAQIECENALLGLDAEDDTPEEFDDGDINGENSEEVPREVIPTGDTDISLFP